MTGSQELYKRVCGAFVANHTTLTRWCACHDPPLHRQNVARALKGKSNGPVAQSLARLAAEAAGVIKDRVWS